MNIVNIYPPNLWELLIQLVKPIIKPLFKPGRLEANKPNRCVSVGTKSGTYQGIIFDPCTCALTAPDVQGIHKLHMGPKLALNDGSREERYQSLETKQTTSYHFKVPLLLLILLSSLF
jgi:hypothetical protein